MEGLPTSVKSALGESTCVKVYRTEDRKIIGVFPSYTKASGFLSVSTCDLSVMIRRKTKHFCKPLKTHVVMRLGNMKDLDQWNLIDRIVRIPVQHAPLNYNMQENNQWNLQKLSKASILELNNLLKETVFNSKFN